MRSQSSVGQKINTKELQNYIRPLIVHQVSGQAKGYCSPSLFNGAKKVHWMQVTCGVSISQEFGDHLGTGVRAHCVYGLPHTHIQKTSLRRESPSRKPGFALTITFIPTTTKWIYTQTGAKWMRWVLLLNIWTQKHTHTQNPAFIIYKYCQSNTTLLTINGFICSKNELNFDTKNIT